MNYIMITQTNTASGIGADERIEAIVTKNFNSLFPFDNRADVKSHPLLETIDRANVEVLASETLNHRMQSLTILDEYDNLGRLTILIREFEQGRNHRDLNGLLQSDKLFLLRYGHLGLLLSCGKDFKKLSRQFLDLGVHGHSAH